MHQKLLQLLLLIGIVSLAFPEAVSTTATPLQQGNITFIAQAYANFGALQTVAFAAEQRHSSRNSTWREEPGGQPRIIGGGAGGGQWWFAGEGRFSDGRYTRFFLSMRDDSFAGGYIDGIGYSGTYQILLHENTLWQRPISSSSAMTEVWQLFPPPSQGMPLSSVGLFELGRAISLDFALWFPVREEAILRIVELPLMVIDGQPMRVFDILWTKTFLRDFLYGFFYESLDYQLRSWWETEASVWFDTYVSSTDFQYRVWIGVQDHHIHRVDVRANTALYLPGLESGQWGEIWDRREATTTFSRFNEPMFFPIPDLRGITAE